MDEVVVTKYPVDVIISRPERSSRWLALAFLLLMIPKYLMLIPHLIALWFVSIVALFVMIFAQFAVLFTGKYPQSMFDFVVGTTRWQTRVNAYFMGLTDSYPPFRMRD